MGDPGRRLGPRLWPGSQHPTCLPWSGRCTVRVAS